MLYALSKRGLRVCIIINKRMTSGLVSNSSSRSSQGLERMGQQQGAGEDGHPDLGANTKTINLASVLGCNHRCRSDYLAPQRTANCSHTPPLFRALIHKNTTLTERWECMHYRMDYSPVFPFVLCCTWIRAFTV